METVACDTCGREFRNVKARAGQRLGTLLAKSNQTDEGRSRLRQAQLRRFSDPGERACYSSKFSGPGNPRWQDDREHLSVRHEFESRVRSSLKQAKKRIFNGDLDFYIEELGYTPRQLKTHVESLFVKGMCWENWGAVWQIDHIVPVSRHSLDSSVSEVNALSNLRPLWKFDNLSKGGRLDEEWRTS